MREPSPESCKFPVGTPVRIIGGNGSIGLTCVVKSVHRSSDSHTWLCGVVREGHEQEDVAPDYFGKYEYNLTHAIDPDLHVDINL